MVRLLTETSPLLLEPVARILLLVQMLPPEVDVVEVTALPQPRVAVLVVVAGTSKLLPVQALLVRVVRVVQAAESSAYQAVVVVVAEMASVVSAPSPAVVTAAQVGPFLAPLMPVVEVAVVTTTSQQPVAVEDRAVAALGPQSTAAERPALQTLAVVAVDKQVPSSTGSVAQAAQVS